jgi:GT2 family glycosyltransferase
VEIIVVDSALDPRVEAVMGRHAGMKLVRSSTRLFPGAARNLGVRQAAAARLAFLDADCIPSGRWARAAIESIEEGAVIVGGPVLDALPFHPIAWVDNHLQFADFQRGRPAGPGDHFPSCNLAMRRDTFEALGGFREDVLTGEDFDFSTRARGLFPQGMWFQPRLVAYHHGRRTLASMLEHQRLLGYYRGLLGLAMTAGWKWLARSSWLGGPAVLRRLAYVSWRTWQYDRAQFLPLLLASPLLLAGLTAWTWGFYAGVRDRAGLETQP